jgi:hypothetical protein
MSTDHGGGRREVNHVALIGPLTEPLADGTKVSPSLGPSGSRSNSERMPTDGRRRLRHGHCGSRSQDACVVGVDVVDHELDDDRTGWPQLKRHHRRTARGLRSCR